MCQTEIQPQSWIRRQEEEKEEEEEEHREEKEKKQKKGKGFHIHSAYSREWQCWYLSIRDQSPIQTEKTSLPIKIAP